MPRRGPRSEPAPLNTRISNHNDGPSSGDSPRPAIASDGRSRFSRRALAKPEQATTHTCPARRVPAFPGDSLKPCGSRSSARRPRSGASRRGGRGSPRRRRAAAHPRARLPAARPNVRGEAAAYHGDDAAAGGAIGGADDEPEGQAALVVRGSWPLSSCCWSSPGPPAGLGPPGRRPAAPMQ